MKENRDELDFEAIMREFSSEEPAQEPTEEPVEAPIAEPAEVSAEEPEQILPAPEEPMEDQPLVLPPKESGVTEDTIRLEQLNHLRESIAAAQEESTEEVPQEPEDATVRIPELELAEPEDAQEQPLPESEQSEPQEPAQEQPRPRPIPFQPKNRLQALKRELIAGPEKRYYEISEQGVGKLQLGILLCLVLVAIAAAADGVYALGNLSDNRLKLMVYGQVLILLLGGLMSSRLMVDGMASLFHGRFTMNTLLTFSFLACCADGAFCLKELRVPVCGAFALEAAMGLWAVYHRRTAQMGQMDTLRKAARLDGLTHVQGYPDGNPGVVTMDGKVSDFMDRYDTPSAPEHTQNVFALLALLLSIAVAVLAGLRNSLSMAVQILATTLLVAAPAGSFVAVSRPFAVLERRLHSVGAVMCGWQGISRLCRKAAFPLTDEDLFPPTAVKMNGMKFCGDRDPDKILAYAAALMQENGGHLAPLFRDMLVSHNGVTYPVENVQFYDGGIGGVICEEPVLVGTMDFLKRMGVELPEGTMVKQAVYISVDGELGGLFAITYPKSHSVAVALSALHSCRWMKSVVLAKDFMLAEGFMRDKFGSSVRRLQYPARQDRDALAQLQPQQEDISMALLTKPGLLPRVYAVSGARAVRRACRMGLTIHLLSGSIGVLIMAAIAVLGDTMLLTPINILLYLLVWLLPSVLVTALARG